MGKPNSKWLLNVGLDTIKSQVQGSLPLSREQFFNEWCIWECVCICSKAPLTQTNTKNPPKWWTKNSVVKANSDRVWYQSTQYMRLVERTKGRNGKRRTHPGPRSSSLRVHSLLGGLAVISQPSASRQNLTVYMPIPLQGLREERKAQLREDHQPRSSPGLKNSSIATARTRAKLPWASFPHLWDGNTTS